MTGRQAPRRGQPRRPSHAPRDAPSHAWFAIAACGVLAWYNNLAGRSSWHRRWYPVVNGCAAVTALAVADAAGLTADDLGLRRDRLRAGLGLGAVIAAPVAAAFAAAALTPAARPLLRDKRVASLSRRQLAYQVLLRIPVGTVAWEEIAFRGVLQAALNRVMRGPAATATASAIFGIWHIRPTAEALDANGLAVDPGRRVAAVTATVAGTAAAGALFSVLRQRSGSLAAPVLVHLTANCAGPIANALASGLDLDSGPRPQDVPKPATRGWPRSRATRLTGSSAADQNRRPRGPGFCYPEFWSRR